MQFNRKLVREAINLFFTGDPKEHPDLEAVLKDMGLPGTEKILSENHPLVVAASEENPGKPFVLCPVDKDQVSSVLHGKADVFANFRHMLGEVFLALGVCETLCLLCRLYLKLCCWRRADHYSRLSPARYPDSHSLVQAPFFTAPAGGGMPLFNSLFAYVFFHAFQRSTNMYAVLGVRMGQSYNGLLERKLPKADCPTKELSDDFIINERTIALFHLYVACCLDNGVTERRKKHDVYSRHVRTLEMLSGKNPGDRCWRKELAECLTKWHPTFQKLKKHKQISCEVDGMIVEDVQVEDSFL